MALHKGGEDHDGTTSNGESYQWALVGYQDIYGHRVDLIDTDGNPVDNNGEFTDAAMRTVDYAVIRFTDSQGNVEYRSWADGPWEDFDDLSGEVEEWENSY